MSRAHMIAVLAGAVACGPREADLLATGNWIDLTHDFSAETIYWPTAKPFSLEVVAAQRTPAGYYYAANNFSAAEHGGTHLDAPVHFAEGKLTTDQIPLDRLVGQGVVVDVRQQAGRDRDYRIDLAALTAWERDNGRIPSGAILLFRTGWSRRWPDRAAYLGTERTGAGAVPELHFPGIDSAAARWLVGNRQVRAVGIDTPSIDYGQSSTFPTHQILLAENIPAFENVANLELLPETGSFIVALPMKIRGGSGGPLRIVAVVPR
jgi:kynurenine formamidase